jgi:hypothetical protein
MQDAKLDIDAIVIDSPCSVPWASMRGDDVRRVCSQCRLHVYDLSQMTRPQIQRLHAKTGGAFCKRVWRRPDGTVLTRDCNRVVRALRRRLRLVGTAAAGLLTLVGLSGCATRPCCGSIQPAEATPPEPATPPKTAARPEPASKPAPEPKASVIMGR